MTDDHTFLLYQEDARKVVLTPRQKGAWLAGEICPDFTDFNLTFQISNQFTGANQISLPFCIDRTETPIDLLDVLRPRLKLRSVSTDGIVHIEFSERLVVPHDIDELISDSRSMRKILNVHVLTVEGQPLSDVNLSWNLRHFSPFSLKLKLHFDNPHLIS